MSSNQSNNNNHNDNLDNESNNHPVEQYNECKDKVETNNTIDNTIDDYEDNNEYSNKNCEDDNENDNDNEDNNEKNVSSEESNKNSILKTCNLINPKLNSSIVQDNSINPINLLILEQIIKDMVDKNQSEKSNTLLPISFDFVIENFDADGNKETKTISSSGGKITLNDKTIDDVINKTNKTVCVITFNNTDLLYLSSF